MDTTGTFSNTYRKITERYCSEIGENVVLRSIPPENDSFECLYAHRCKARDRCKKCPKKP